MFKQMPDRIKIVEVGPRDGLQNEKTSLSLEDKLKYIELLSQTGLETIEATSFVRADRIPQMADAEKLFEALKETTYFDKIGYPCLVPNIKGFELAKKVGVKEISLFSATSGEFTKKNINCTIEESFERMKAVATMAKAEGMKIRAYISTAFGCPYAGKMSIQSLVDVVEKFLELDVYELSVGDTIGVGNPKQVYESITALEKVTDLSKIAMHFHDTRGMGMANILASLEKGIRVFDASSGGLGGCPYAAGATGNVATEDVLYLAETMGIKTGVDEQKVYEASKFILGKVNKTSPSKYFHLLEKKYS